MHFFYFFYFCIYFNAFSVCSIALIHSLCFSELNESNSQIDYECLGVNAERVVLDRAPAITDPRKRPLHLHSTGLQIEAATNYLRQKPWWAKRDPLRRLLPEEDEASRTAEEVARALETLEGGEGTSRAAEEEAANEDELRTLVSSP